MAQFHVETEQKPSSHSEQLWQLGWNRPWTSELVLWGQSLCHLVVQRRLAPAATTFSFFRSHFCFIHLRLILKIILCWGVGLLRNFKSDNLAGVESNLILSDISFFSGNYQTTETVYTHTVYRIRFSCFHYRWKPKSN